MSATLWVCGRRTRQISHIWLNKGSNTGILECNIVVDLLHVPIDRLEIDLSIHEDDDRMSCISIVSAYITCLSNNLIKIRPLMEKKSVSFFF